MSCFYTFGYFSGAIEEYQTQNEGKLPASLNDLVPDYLEQFPNCPRHRGEGTSYLYLVNDKGDDYEIRCTSDHSHWYLWTDELNYSPQRFRHFGSIGRLESSNQPPAWAAPLVE